jgi:hypothetical protein
MNDFFTSVRSMISVVNFYFRANGGMLTYSGERPEAARPLFVPANIVGAQARTRSNIPWTDKRSPNLSDRVRYRSCSDGIATPIHCAVTSEENSEGDVDTLWPAPRAQSPL